MNIREEKGDSFRGRCKKNEKSVKDEKKIPNHTLNINLWLLVESSLELYCYPSQCRRVWQYRVFTKST